MEKPAARLDSATSTITTLKFQLGGKAPLKQGFSSAQKTHDFLVKTLTSRLISSPGSGSVPVRAKKTRRPSLSWGISAWPIETVPRLA